MSKYTGKVRKRRKKNKLYIHIARLTTAKTAPKECQGVADDVLAIASAAHARSGLSLMR